MAASQSVTQTVTDTLPGLMLRLLVQCSVLTREVAVGLLLQEHKLTTLLHEDYKQLLQKAGKLPLGKD